MEKSLDNQDAVIQELAESRSRDKGLKERLDQMNRRQEGFGQLIVEILSSTATSTIPFSARRTRQTSLETDLMDAVQNAQRSIRDEDMTRLQISPHRLVRIQEEFISIFRYDSMFDREVGVAEAHC